MEGPENKSRVRRLFDEVLNQGRLDALETLVSTDYTEHSPVPGQLPGRAGVRARIQALRTAFPDIRFTMEDILCEGDRVAVRYRWQGTHQGTLMNLAATGRRVTVTGMDFYRLEQGAIVEHWRSMDELGLMRQLGVVAV